MLGCLLVRFSPVNTAKIAVGPAFQTARNWLCLWMMMHIASLQGPWTLLRAWDKPGVLHMVESSDRVYTAV